MRIRSFNLNVKVKVSILVAISFILTYFKINVPFLPSFLNYDLSDIPIFLISLMISPTYGIVGMGLKNILEVLITGSFTYGVGEIANFIMGSFFVYFGALVFNKIKSNRKYILSYIASCGALTISGVILNYFVIIPIYAKAFGMNILDIIGMGTLVNSNIDSLFTLLLFAIVPYNIIKSIIIWFPTIYILKKINKKV